MTSKIEKYFYIIIKYFIIAIVLCFFCFSVLLYSYNDHILTPLSVNETFNSIVSISGFLLTALGFIFVIIQMSALAHQANKQEENFHKDNEFKNFLEATKMLTSNENKYNAPAKISAMYLLYDYAKKYPKNIEKVIKVLNRFPTPYFYPEIKCKEKRVISEWKQKGNSCEQVASIALELIKKLFAFSIENKSHLLDLSGVILFNFDVDVDVAIKKLPIKLTNVVAKLDNATLLWCNFSKENQDNEKVFFSTESKKVVEETYKKSNTGKFDITLSNFVHCNLTGCDFSYSNLWGAKFEDCILNQATFTHAECEGVEFDQSKIEIEQIKSMLFLGKEDFAYLVDYGIIYKEDKNVSCFKSQEKYKEYKDNRSKLK